jgi:hypothetical protein
MRKGVKIYFNFLEDLERFPEIPGIPGIADGIAKIIAFIFDI